MFLKKIIILGLFPIIAFGSGDELLQNIDCLSTREYITVMNYLRDHKEFKLKKSDMVSYADQVSKGCSGAAKNFIRVTNLLLKVQLDGGTSLKTGIKFSDKKPIIIDAFIEIFKRTYMQKYFDMSLQKSLKVATELSLNFEGDTTMMLSDFKKLTEFCGEKDALTLKKSQCAQFASKVSILSSTYKKEMSKPFIALFEFMTENNDGPKLPTYKALQLAQTSINFGPNASINFEKAYIYGTSEKGLKLQRDKAVEFALEMAKRSSIRSPASLVKPQ